MNQFHRKILKKKYPEEYKEMEQLLNLNSFTNLIEAYIENKRTKIYFRDVVRMKKVFIEIRSKDSSLSCVKIKIDDILSNRFSSNSSSSHCSTSSASDSCGLSNERNTDFEISLLTETEKNNLAKAIREDIITFFNFDEIEEQKKYAASIVYCLHLITRHDLCSYSFLLNY